jgi:uroporphyrinogen-III synthase
VANRIASSGFSGLRVLSLESRRAAEMAKLILHHGGQPIVTPSMREVPLESNTEALAFARTLASGGLDIIIFLTGVGIRALTRVVETLYPRKQFADALRRLAVVARGPKPVAALKDLGVGVTLAVPEPNTWRDLLLALDEKRDTLSLDGRRVAVQEYGATNSELLAGLEERGARVTRVPVYQWAMPDDVGPLRAAVEAIARGEIDVILFTTSIQVVHLWKIATEMRLEDDIRHAFGRIFIGSIGPITSQSLHEHGLSPGVEPEHPRMGFLVDAAAHAVSERARTFAAAPKSAARAD